MGTSALSKAVPTEVRLHNKTMIMRLLYPDHEMTRADVSRATGLTRMVVSDIVSELIDNKLITEVGFSKPNGPGKRGILLKFDADSRCVVALDLSQPYVFRGAVMNLLGHVLPREESVISVTDTTPLEVVGKLCRQLIERTDTEVLGIAVSVPGIVDAHGVVRESVNLGWKDTDLRSYLTDLTGLPVHVDNDSNAQTMAELRFGAAEPNMMLVQIARGVGGGIILNGDLYVGTSRAAGEIGHVVVDPEGVECVCGKRGCLETVIAIPRLVAQIDADPIHRDEILRQAGDTLGRALSMPLGALDIPLVMVQGDSSVVNRSFLDSAERALNKAIATDLRTHVRVRRSALGQDAALLGHVPWCSPNNWITWCNSAWRNDMPSHILSDIERGRQQYENSASGNRRRRTHSRSVLPMRDLPSLS